MPEFAFATCLPGNEPAVKREVARTRPELRFAYSRPGLLTFRAPGDVTPEDPSGSVFARVWGRSVGAAKDIADASSLLATLRPDRIHLFLRDPDGDVALLDPWRVLTDIAETSRDENAKKYSIVRGGEAEVGELIADVIVGPAGEPVWIGAHRHRAGLPATAGGGEPAQVPEDSPSRAFAKIEEAIAWARLPVKAGQVALEIGAAPGGAVLALARRGLEVWACDTGDLAPNVAALPGVHHLAKKVGAVRWEELPARIDWLLVDVNLAPQVALHEVARLMPRLRPTLKGAVITLKMNDWAFVDELPKLVERIAEMGLPNVRLRHLPANRREVCAVALP